MRADAYATSASRPDGKPLRFHMYASAPPELPQCPTNGLVVHREFTNAEADRLAAYIGGDDFSRMRRRDRTFYIAYRTELFLNPAGAALPNVLLLLQSASWQADNNASLKRRYQRELADAVQRLEPSSDDFDTLIVLAWGANALRELGRFAEANHLLAKIPREHLDVSVPDEVRKPLGEGWETLNHSEIEEARGRRMLLHNLVRLDRLVALRDARSEPPDFVETTKQRAGRDN